MNHRDYMFSSDGLIYKYGTNELYTGLVVDTADVIITFEVVNGIKEGEFITFYLNGKVEKYGLISNDRNEGEWQYFYPNGKIESIGTFHKNRPEGLWTSYYQDGKIKTEGSYRNGKQNGIWNFYDSYGELINSLIFQEGVICKNEVNT
ncbi:MAG TPA: hypothetical protein VLM39_11925 [Ignavibacteriaceae bacterium]|nr:hypothetical protein [Ignavibacteriaceae bacterium]